MTSTDHASILSQVSDEALAAEVDRRRNAAAESLNKLRNATLRHAAGQDVSSFANEIAALVTRAAGVFFSAPGDILGKSRQTEAIEARHSIYLALHTRGRSYNSIAKMLKVDHCTVMHGCMRAQLRNQTNPRHLAAFEALMAANDQAQPPKDG